MAEPKTPLRDVESHLLKALAELRHATVDCIYFCQDHEQVPGTWRLTEEDIVWIRRAELLAREASDLLHLFVANRPPAIAPSSQDDKGPQETTS